MNIEIIPQGILQQNGQMITHAWVGGIMYYKLLTENLQEEIKELKEQIKK